MGRASTTSIESDILPTFDTTSREGRDADVQSPKLFAPTPTPEILTSTSQSRIGKPGDEKNVHALVSTKRTDQGFLTVSPEQNKTRAGTSRQRVKQEPVRMPIARIHSAVSASSVPHAQEYTGNQPQGRKPGPLTLKKARSNVDVAPSSLSKPRQQSHSNIKLSSNVSRNIPPQHSSPIRKTLSSNSVKNSGLSPSNSPRRSSEQRFDQGNPDRKVSGDSQTSPLSPSEGSEVGSNHDVISPTLSSSSDGEVNLSDNYIVW